MAMRVLVLGGTGMLGHKLVQVLSAEPALDVHATLRRMPPDAFISSGATYHSGVDLRGDSGGLARVLRDLAPDFVVNAIGGVKQKDLLAAVDETFFVNATLPHLIPFLNPNADGKVIHFSTDCVFRGDRGGYRESDVPDATDLYGRTKICGEIAYGRHVTLRTSIVGFEIAGRLSLLSWLMGQPPGSTLRGYTQAFFSGLPTVTLSHTVLDVIMRRPDLSGLYHVASEPISKHELLLRVSDALGLTNDIVPDDSFRIDRTLDDEVFRRATGTKTPGWRHLIEELKKDFESHPYDEIYRV